MEWIKTSDRRPDLNIEILFLVKEYDQIHIGDLRINRNIHFLSNTHEEFLIHEISHWMPLPELPQG